MIFCVLFFLYWGNIYSYSTIPTSTFTPSTNTMPFQQVEFSLSPKSKGCHLITKEVEKHLPKLPPVGLLNLFIKHTSAGLTINENYDPTVRSDLSSLLDRIVPEGSQYDHDDEGPDDMPAHGKSTLTGASLMIPIKDGRLNLGTWQGIYLCEFRNHGGSRTLCATIMG